MNISTKIMSDNHYKTSNGRCFLKLIYGFILFMVFGCVNDIQHYSREGRQVEEKVGELIYYVESQFDHNKKLFIDKLHKTTVIPEQSALVLIDVWQRSFLDSLTINHINPLIEEFSTKGAKIIYAPSQEPENENLLIIEDSVHFYDLDIMDSYLQENNIQNLFYVGFDTFHCILDKPNGIFSVKKRNTDLQIFLLEEGVLSYTKEMMETSITLLKKNGAKVIRHHGKEKKFPSQTITNVYAKTIDKVLTGNHFVLLFENMDKNMALEDFNEELNMLGVDYGIIKNDKLYFKGEFIKPQEFYKFLQKREIRNLFYAGSYLNNELLWSEYGILPLYITIRYQGVQGLPWPFIINDLTSMLPTKSLDTELEKATILNHYRMIHNIKSETLLDIWNQM